MPPEGHQQPAAVAVWILAIASRSLACSLNMPEPLLQSTGVYVYAQLAAAESRRPARNLCPISLVRRLRTWFHNLTA